MSTRMRVMFFSLLFAMLGLAIVGGIYGLLSWVNVETGTAMLVVDAMTGTIGGPRLGPTAGFFINGLKRAFGLEYPVFIYYQMDTVGMWSEWKQSETNPDIWIETSRGDYPAVKTLSKDGLEIEVDVQVRWSLNPDALVELFKKYPNKNWKDMTINSIIREEVRDTIAGFTAIDVIEKRALIADILTENIKKGLVEEPSLKDAIVTGNLVVDLRDIDPSIEFIKAIDRKMAAQEAKKQAEFEYERALTLAKAEAESKIIVAQGVKEAVSIIVSVTGETNSTRIAELYLTLEALKTVSAQTETFIVIFGKEGIPVVYPIPQEAEK